MIVKTKLVRFFQAAAITVWPFVFIDPLFANSLVVMEHEAVHLEQQKRWAIYGLGIGLLAWHVLYLLALPVGWNYFRDKWEREAYKVSPGYDDEIINQVMKKPPYYLWWM